ncbi:MAG: Gfo/Idh/MocA family oxidoreductase [Planctomycetota bacterium]
MTPTVGIALLGTKFMGKAHSNAWGQAARFFDLPCKPKLATVVGRNQQELDAFAERWGWEQTAPQWQDVVADDAIAIVDIATPNDVHAEPAVAALAAGKHVVCEKPLAGTLADARRMRDAAVSSSGQSFVWFNYRRCPAIALAHRMVRDGRLGRIYHVRASYLQSWGGPDTPLLWRFQKAHAGSGAHGDLNAHIVDLARFLTGDEIVEVHGAIEKTFVTERTIPGTDAVGTSDVDDCVSFLASLAGGATASFEATRLAVGHLNRNCIEINGADGSLAFDFEDMNTLRFCDASDPASERGWRRIVCTAAEHPYMAAWWPDAHLIGYEHGFTNMAADVLRVLSGAQAEVPLPTFVDAYETQRVLEAALIAARERRAVELTEVP